VGKIRKTVSVISVKVVVQGMGADESTEGVVYMMKSRKPRTEPWKTPQEVHKDKKALSHLTQKERDDKYDLNQLRTEHLDRFSRFCRPHDGDKTD